VPAEAARYRLPMPAISRSARGRLLATCLLATAIVVIGLGVAGLLHRPPVVVVAR
jgi:hypothetical protein